MVKLEKEYTFDGPDGKVSLSDLFKGRRQLILYHFMLGPDDTVGCHGCSFVADNLPSTLGHLNSRDTTLVFVSRAPLEKIEAYKKRMGWKFPWYSSFGSDFNFDFHVTLDPSVAVPEYNYKAVDPATKGERPGFSVFFKEGNELFHTYSTHERGSEPFLVTHSLLDMTPLGRQDGSYGPMSWKRHDEYATDDAIPSV